MFNRNSLHKNERGQAALETAIILIAFVVVASVFAFTILSAGSASTEKGEAAIYSGLQGVQSSMAPKGAVIAEGDTASSPKKVTKVTFTLSLVAGGDPVDLTKPGGGGAGTPSSNRVVVSYRDAQQVKNEMPWDVKFIGSNDGDMLLEDGELAEITVDVSGLTTALGVNTEFTLEVKPPTGAVLNINRTTPAAIEKVMELR